MLAAAFLAAGCAARPAGPGPAGLEASGPWKPLPAPGPGDWLYIHPEKDQPFEDFKAERSSGRNPGPEAAICIQPLGNVSSAHPDLMKDLAEFASAFFDRRASVLDPIPIPEASFHPKRSQYDAGVVLGLLSAGMEPGVCACLGIIERDLFLEGYAFLYGLGSLKRGVGVCSIARYNIEYIGMDPSCTLEKRSLKVAVHELCHALGLRHCVKWQCVMNGANSIVEADRSPMHLCPDCLRKLEWLMGFDRRKRYQRLAAFFKAREGFEKEAAFACEAAERVRPASQDFHTLDGQ